LFWSEDSFYSMFLPMKLRKQLRVAFAFTFTFALIARLPLHGMAAEPDVTGKDLPRIAPTDPDKAISTFQIKNGFRLELVAAEPLVVDPIAMAFDENGRLFVVEMRDYPERRNETPHLGRIRMLEDTDEDGRFDKSTVYVDNLPWPTAVSCWHGGVFVGATPDILYCKDTNNDGVADVREVIFTGLASDYAPYEVNKLNVQALFNGFVWGLDNRIHAANGGDGGKITRVESTFVRDWIRDSQAGSPAAGLPLTHTSADGSSGNATRERPPDEAGTRGPLDLRGHDFSFDPRTLAMRLESGGGQYGLSFDNRGRKFVCSNSAHLREVMYEDRYSARNPFLAMPPAAMDIAEDGPAAPVYRLSPDEPWRVIRTRWRVTGLVPGPIEGGGRPSGYFSGATGITIYRGDAFPPDFRENAFVGDCGSNLIHRKKLFPDGVGSIARRPDDEQKVEFLASRDNWFRPVSMANAPDGTLYIADMYREVIEHPWSLPGSIKKYLDLNSGNDRGRIYRIMPDGFKQRKPPRLSAAATRELVALLAHPNGWHRDTAARLLYERQDRSAAALLENLLKHSPSPLARMQALCVLNGMGQLDETTARQALKDPDGLVRENAVRLAGNVFFSSYRKPWNELARLADDPEPRVRYQLAFALGEFLPATRLKTLARIIRRDAGDRWMRAAVLNSLKDGAGEIFRTLSVDSQFRNSKGGEFLSQLVELIGTKNDSSEVKAVLDYLEKNAAADIAFLLTRALGAGLQHTGHSLGRVDSEGKLRRIFARAKATASDGAVSEQTRVQAIRLLAMSSFDEAGEVLASLLGPDRSEPVQLAAVEALAKFNGPKVNEALLARWQNLAGRVRAEVVAVMLTRPERILAVFKAVEQRKALASDFTAQQLQMLRAHRDAQIRDRAIQLFGEPPAAKRDEVVKAYLPALQLRGNPANGKKIYLERCATCHRIGSQGNAVGPDLMTVKTAARETLLVNILDPNREVAPRYLNYTVETRSGESFSGLMVGESASSITLRGPNATETAVLRPQIARLQASGQSLMPEGLELGLTSQDLADLIEYLGDIGVSPHF
jgi:putative membrane-bound dehydrogenase-like protein